MTLSTEEERLLSKVRVLILAGGASARLFPFNKVLSDLTGAGRTLIQQAFDRVTRVYPNGSYRRFLNPEVFYVGTGESMVLPIRSQLHLPSSRFFVDPARRGTWPAILWAMAHLRREDPEGILAVLTADHIIPQVQPFRDGVARAVAWAASRPAIVLLGVTPSAQPDAWRGFGCLRLGKPSGNQTVRARQVVGFEEKPALERAQAMIGEGGWVWNAGMFFFRIALAERALRRHQPQMAAVYDELSTALAKGNETRAKTLYKAFPAQIPHPLDPARLVDNTIDYALLPSLVRSPSEDGELYGIAHALPQWTDVGEWPALGQLIAPDSRENVKVGRAAADSKTRACILIADRLHALETRGLQDAVVALANGTALIIARSCLPSIKSLVAEAQAQPKAKVVQLAGAQCDVSAKGGRVVVAGPLALSIRLVKNRLRVESKPAVL